MLGEGTRWNGGHGRLGDNHNHDSASNSIAALGEWDYELLGMARGWGWGQPAERGLTERKNAMWRGVRMVVASQRPGLEFVRLTKRNRLPKVRTPWRGFVTILRPLRTLDVVREPTQAQRPRPTLQHITST